MRLRVSVFVLLAAALWLTGSAYAEKITSYPVGNLGLTGRLFHAPLWYTMPSAAPFSAWEKPRCLPWLKPCTKTAC